jgi:hypothetical protein
LTDDADVAALRAEVAHLQRGLKTRAQVGAAMGILAGTLGISTERAWDVLLRVSTTTNTKMRDIARVIVEAHDGKPSDADEGIAHQIATALGSAPDTLHRRPDSRQPV